MAESPLKTGTGMVLGKFLPPHLGHKYLVDFARAYVERLTVIVGTLKAEPIPGEVRFQWMKRMFPDVEVLHLTDENPQAPHEHPDFWNIWHKSIRRHLPEGPDYVFASEPYGFRLAEILGARCVPVDFDRELAPISGAALREDPMGCWRFIPSCVRPWFVKRVCVFGPESTGKSVLTRNLARRFETVYVHEYARALLDTQDCRCAPEDFHRIARGHIAAEEALAEQANRVLFCDTDLITTVLFSELFYGDCPEWIRREADRRTYDLYLLMDIDTPYVADPQRNHPHAREAFMERCVRELESRGRRYVRISGGWEERFEKACAAVEELLAG